jgi:hypothetical protein
MLGLTKLFITEILLEMEKLNFIIPLKVHGQEMLLVDKKVTLNYNKIGLIGFYLCLYETNKSFHI